MKVAFVGSFSTGKTTLANLFAREWDFPLLPEVAREVVKLGLPARPERHRRDRDAHLPQAVAGRGGARAFVADRSIYDVLAYADWVMEHTEPTARRTTSGTSRGRSPSSTSGPATTTSSTCRSSSPSCSTASAPTTPASRPTSTAASAQLLESHDVAHHTLTGSVEERQEQVRNRWPPEPNA